MIARKLAARDDQPPDFVSRLHLARFEVFYIKKSDLTAMPRQGYRAVHSLRLSLFGILLTTNLIALPQSIPSEHLSEPNQSAPTDLRAQPHGLRPFSLLNPLKPQTLEGTYRPITLSQRTVWFITSTIGPPHMAGIAFLSACGTALDRPEEYGTHWGGFTDRFWIGMAGSALGNAIEASLGIALREDPRYFRVPQEPLKVRVGSVARQTFLARGASGTFRPAYARYTGFLGGSFISNTWRVPSEANAQDALRRSTEGFAGRMATNAFQEFWPDVKKHLFSKRNRVTQQSEDAD